MRNRTFFPAFLSVALLACGAETPAPQAPLPAPLPDPTPIATPPVDAPVSTPIAAPAEPKADPAAKPAFATSSRGNEFTMSMLRALHGEKGNVFFSGESLREALGMTALGAKGKTLEEMAQTLGVDADPAKNAANEKKELDAWRHAAGKAELVVANRLWIANSYPLDKTFLGETQSGYDATATPTDFLKAPEPSRQRINTWVGETTKGKIKDLLPPGSLSTETRLVLTNAIYFKGSWATAFTKSATRDEAFQADSGSLNVPTMHRNDPMSYGESGDVRLVELPYKDSDLTLLVALPKAGTLVSVEKDLTGGQVDAWAKSLSRAKVDLSLPKFTFSWGRSVKSELQGLGIRTAFTSHADFTAMAPNAGEPLMVGDVFHKGFVLVDETGTEAAAATAVTMIKGHAVTVEKTVVLKVDHPFLFFVRNGKTGEVLFTGRVANPKG
jgi:serpin B